MEVQKKLEALLKKLHVVYGFAYVGDFTNSKYYSTPYAIAIGLPLSPDIVDCIVEGPTQIYYDEYLTVNAELDKITEQLKFEIEKNGYRAHAIPSSKRTDFINIRGEFPHKAAAVRGGLGWIGKSSLLITKKYGPRIRISTILTDIPFETNDVTVKNYCGKCKKCTDSCPAGAIVGNFWDEQRSREDLIDVKKCDSWKVDHYAQFHGQVCGICVAVCPHGK